MMNGAPDFMGENQFEESQVENNHLSDLQIHAGCCFCEWCLKVKRYFHYNDHKTDFICCSFNKNNNCFKQGLFTEIMIITGTDSIELI